MRTHSTGAFKDQTKDVYKSTPGSEEHRPVVKSELGTLQSFNVRGLNLSRGRSSFPHLPVAVMNAPESLGNPRGLGCGHCLREDGSIWLGN